jgi:hypothetical protein
VDTNLVSEGFLTESLGLSVGTEVPPHDALKIPDSHGFEGSVLLLVSLQTYT